MASKQKPKPFHGVDEGAFFADITAKGGSPTLRATTYTGGKLYVDGYEYPVVLDLDGYTRAKPSNLPLYLMHDTSRQVGTETSFEVKAGRLHQDAVLDQDNDDRDLILFAKEHGKPLQPSIGATPITRPRLIKAGASKKVNGQNLQGPFYYVGKFRQNETSIVEKGGDLGSSLAIAAKLRDELANKSDSLLEEKTTMDEALKSYLATIGHTAESFGSLSSEVQANLKAQSELKAEPTPDPIVPAKGGDGGSEEGKVPLSVKEQAAADMLEVAAVQAKFSEFPELGSKALSEGWDSGRQDTELKLAKVEAKLKETPEGDFGGWDRVPNAHVSEGMETIEDHQRAVEASYLTHRLGLGPESILQPKGQSEVMARLGVGSEFPVIEEKHIKAAYGSYAGWGFGEAIDHFNKLENKNSKLFRQDRNGAIRASFTTISNLAIWQNVCNRILVARLPTVPDKWREIVSVGPGLSDMREFSGYRYHIGGCWEKVECGSSISHGTIGAEDVYKGEASMVAKMMMLCEHDFINDNVGALGQIAQSLVDNGLRQPEMQLQKMLLNNVNYNGDPLFGPDNIIALPGEKYGADVIQKIKDFFCNKKANTGRDCEDDCETQYLDLAPYNLLVPTCGTIAGIADAWNVATNLKDCCNGEGDEVGLNRYRNCFSRICEWVQLNGNVDANDDPNAIFAFSDRAPMFEIRFLQNRQRPLIETGQPSFDKLGMGMRGTYGFSLHKKEDCGLMVDFTAEGAKALKAATTEKLAAAKIEAKAKKGQA